LALVHSMSLPPRNGNDCHALGLFAAQILYHPSKGSSKLAISPWLSRNRKAKVIVTWWLIVRASDSHFGVTLHAL